MHLEGAILEGTHLDGACLEGAHLEGAFMKRAHLESANLRKARLEGANLALSHCEGTGFREAADAPGKHPVFYLKPRGKGGVLYNTLGHCRGHYDLQPLAPWWPTLDRCAWDLPVFYDLLRRGIGWLKDREPA